MKIFIVFFVAMVLICGSMEANAKSWIPLGEHSRLLSDANLGRKVNLGAADKGTVGVNKEAADEKNYEDNNGSYGDFGHGQAGSSTDTHRFFPCVARTDCSNPSIDLATQIKAL